MILFNTKQNKTQLFLVCYIGRNWANFIPRETSESISLGQISRFKRLSNIDFEEKHKNMLTVNFTSRMRDLACAY